MNTRLDFVRLVVKEKRLSRSEATVYFAKNYPSLLYGEIIDALAVLIQKENSIFHPEREKSFSFKKSGGYQRLQRLIPNKTRRNQWDRQPYIPPTSYMKSVSAEAIRTWRIKPGAKEMLFLLWQRGGGALTVIAPTFWLASEMGRTKRTIQNYRNDLVNAGYVTHEVTKNDEVIYRLSVKILPPNYPPPSSAEQSRIVRLGPVPIRKRGGVPRKMERKGAKIRSPYPYKEDSKRFYRSHCESNGQFDLEKRLMKERNLVFPLPPPR